jgi:hypothetical protein
VTVSDGAALRLLDPNAVPGTGSVSGESLTVGRIAGGNGTLTVDTQK